MTDMRRDWRLYLRMRADKITVPDWDGWTYVEEGTQAHCRRERDRRTIGPDEHWVDWSIRRPNGDRTRSNDIVEAVWELLVERVIGPRCSPLDHVGPIAVSATEPIDDGVALTMKCGNCGGTSETSVSLDELDWRN